MSKQERIEKARVAAVERFKVSRAEIPETLDAPLAPDEEHGIKNLLEVMVLIEAIAVTAIDVLRDGLSPLDILDVFRAEDLREAIPDAFDGIGELDDEALDLSAEEIFVLLERTAKMAKNIVMTVIRGT